MTALARGLAVLRENPRVLYRGLAARLRARRGLPEGLAAIEINGVQVPFDPQYVSYLNNLYYGARDVALQTILQHYLAEGDVFLDVGANIGRTSVLALGLVGPTGAVHCFEPAPHYRQFLERIRQANPRYRLLVNGVAVGDLPGTARLVLSRGNIGANSLVPGFVPAHDREKTIETPVIRLDDYLAENAIDRVALIHIDAEGYEFPVLKGLDGFLRRTARRPPIVCEINPWAYRSLGIGIETLLAYLREHGYEARSLYNPRRRIVLRESRRGDVLLLPASAVAAPPPAG